MRTSAEVRSCIFLIFTFLFFIASSIDSEMESVVSPHGNWVMTSLFLSASSITARTFTLPVPS